MSNGSLTGHIAETKFSFEIYPDPSDASRVLIKHPDGSFRSERPRLASGSDRDIYIGCTFISRAALERIYAVPSGADLC
jgi:hypothetical protein